MASYNVKYNFDDSVIRHIIIGLLADLNNKVYFHRQMDAKTRTVIDVPFYYSITGDDQFLRDNFLFTTTSGFDCVPDKAFADANYDQIPRGVAQMSSLAIDNTKLVNKRITGQYTKMNAEGAMEGYAAEFEMIPVTVRFDIEVLVSSTLDAFKITEAIIKRLYKSNYFNVEVGHLDEGTYRLASYYAIPEDFEIVRPVGFTFEDKEKYKITFPVDVNSFIPAFDFDSETHAGNRMFEIRSSIIPRPTLDTPHATTNADFDTAIITESGVTATMTPSLSTTSTYNPSGVQLSSTPSNNTPIQMLDATEFSNPIYLNSVVSGNEIILIATNGNVEIDTTNFAAATSATILEGGSMMLKYYMDKWYVVGSSNSNVAY